MRAVTAGEVVNRIKALMALQGVQWSDASTRDRFKFGGPDTVVTGIATSFMGTFEAISKASAMGLNMVIPHEDTYWNDPDNTSIAATDTLVYKTKVDFMTKHNIVVFRIHDHMHRQRPDFTFSGTAREVGLDPMTETAPNSHRFVIPETTLGELAARVKKVRGDDAIRVVGDPRAKVSRIATGAGMATPAVNAADIDVRTVDGRRGIADAKLNPADLRVRIADDSKRLCPEPFLKVRCEGPQSCFGNREAMRLGRRFVLTLEAESARSSDIGEVGPLRVHVIVNPENDDVVLRHEVDLRLVHEGVGFRDRRVVRIVPVRVLMRDDQVETQSGGLRDRLERAHEGRRDAADDGIGPAELEPVARRRVAPRHALERHQRLDAVDDFACGHCAH